MRAKLTDKNYRNYAPILKVIYDFGHPEFVKLIAEQDVFSMRIIKGHNNTTQDLIIR